ncbi:MAG: aldehyde dehydrogenase family protein [Planctomycetaceae bacterium]
MIDATPHPDFDFQTAIKSARTAQREWRSQPIGDRLKIVRNFRHFIAAEPTMLAAWCNRTNMVESLTAEVLPILDACRFLEKTAAKTLAGRKLSGKGRSSWLRGVDVELRRDPFGLVLVIAPSNYPLMLPGIQALQALIAGNAVMWKPAAGCSDAARWFREFLIGTGLDECLLLVLPEAIDSVENTISCGVDKVILTGSADTGRAIQQRLADKLVPATMELSGCDAMFVTASADLDLAVKCLWLGLTMNSSRTCIAPRRVLVDQTVASQFKERLASRLDGAGDLPSSDLQVGIDSAVDSGAHVLQLHQPTILADVTPNMQIAQKDIFEPVTSVMTYGTIDEAIAMNDECPYALGATIIGSGQSVDELADRINAGCIVVNDMIVPTADPRVPFGGRKQSGFGVTRGTAGLEEMTQLKAIVRQNSSWLPHLDEPTPLDEDVITNLIQTLHSPSIFSRMTSSLRLAKAAMQQRKHRQETKSALPSGRGLG